MDYKEKYEQALKRARKYKEKYNYMVINTALDNIFPELKESENERIRKELKQLIGCMHDSDPRKKDWIACLEKQKPIDEDAVLKGVRRGIAISIINFLDYNTKGMCLSNMECEDIENAVINEDWKRVYNYMKKKLDMN